MSELEYYTCISYNPEKCTKRCKVSAPIDVEYCGHMLTYGTVFWTKGSENND